MNEPKQSKRTYLTAHKANGRWYFKEHKTNKPDLWTQIQEFNKKYTPISCRKDK